jgi:hypothetical protein
VIWSSKNSPRRSRTISRADMRTASRGEIVGHAYERVDVVDCVFGEAAVGHEAEE